MRSILSFLTPLIILIPAMVQGQWEIVNEGTLYDFQSVDFINKDTGWHSGLRGLFKTDDGAESWIRLNEWTFKAIDFLNDTLGWALTWGQGDQVGIWKSVDGGRNWIWQTTVTCSDRVTRIDHINVLSDQVVYASGGGIWRTANGGEDWIEITPAEGIYFEPTFLLHPDTAVFHGGDYPTFFRTHDGGSSWIMVTSRLRSFGNISPIGRLSYGFSAYGPSDEWGIYLTEDGFKSWNLISEPGFDFYGNFMAFFGKDTILTLGQGPDSISDSNVFLSSDRGVTWKPIDEIYISGQFTWRHLYCIGDVAYFLTSGTDMSYLIMSTNRGEHWTRQHLTFPIRDIHFLDTQSGYIAGGYEGFHQSGGFVMHSLDQGQSWEPLPEYSQQVNKKIQFINDSVGFILRNLGLPCATTDRGLTWKTIEETEFLRQIMDIHALNDSVSWMLHDGWNEEYDSLVIRRTLDGGETWGAFSGFSQEFDNHIYLFSLSAKNRDTVFAIGEEGEIFRFTEQGFKRVLSGTTLPLNRIVFMDQKYGLITGGYSNGNDFRPIILLTEDGGDHWTEGPEIPYLIHDLQFINRWHGFAVGQDIRGHGVLLETFDSGVSWDAVISGDDSLSVLRALHITDSIGWAAGDNNLILINKSIPVKNTDPKAEPFNEHFMIYPNPTSGFVMIDARTSCLQSIEVFTMNGQCILRREVQDDSFQLDLYSFQKGVYFITIHSKDFVTTRKIIKL